jgi:hypothetical protein
MVLLAAPRIAMVPIRSFFATHRDSLVVPDDWTTGLLWLHASYVSAILKPLVISWGAALRLLRLRQPRPPLRRVFRQPGTAACTAIVISFVFESSRQLIKVSFDVMNDLTHEFWHGIAILSLIRLEQNVGGPAVLIAWVALDLGRACRPERSWIDLTPAMSGRRHPSPGARLRPARRHQGWPGPRRDG